MGSVFGKLKRLQSAAQDFLEERGIETGDVFESAWWRRTIHFWLLVGKSFWRNRCPVRASALAYTTLLALIPLLAIAVSVTTSLLQNEGEKPIREFIDYLVANVAPALNLQTQESGSALLSVSDIKELSALAARLKQPAPTDDISQYLASHLSSATSNLLHQTGDGSGAQLAQGLVQDLNRIMQNGALYERQRFASVNLSLDTQDLLKQEPKGADLVRLNRMLLHDAYPEEIASIEESNLNNRRTEVVTKITDFIANIRSGTFGVTSTIALVFVAIGLLRTIEAAFNDIWGVTRGRGWFLSLVQYWTVITLGPVIMVCAVGLTSSQYIAKSAAILHELGWLGLLVLKILPFAIASLAFAGFYALMPNTRVHWESAVVGGAVGGCLWQFNNLFNVIYVSRVVSYSRIYGSLGIIPLFLVGLYFSWLIVLFGAQVAYAFQNRQAYLQERQAEGVNQRGREFIAVRIMAMVANCFSAGQKPPSLSLLAETLGVPTQLISQILQSLLRARLVVEVVDGDMGYAPARPLERITAHQVTQALRAGQGTELATKDGPLRKVVREEVQRIRKAEQEVAEGVTLSMLVEREREAVAAAHEHASSKKKTSK